MQSREAEREGTHSERLMRRIVRHMQLRTVSMAFSGWSTAVAERRRRRVIMQRRLAQWRQRQLAGCYRRWVEYTETRQGLRRFVGRRLGR